MNQKIGQFETRKSGKYQAVILAAGRGSRMKSVGATYPKPMLPVLNRPLIEHQIETVKRLGVEDIQILIGHKGYEIAKVLGDGSRYGVKLNYVEQEEMLGIAHAVGQLENKIDRPFLLLLGDIFFVPGRLETMLEIYEQQPMGAVLATKNETDPSRVMLNYTVLLRDDETVHRVIEKPRHAQSNRKGVGLYLFDPSIFDAIRRTPRTAMRNEYELTDSIQVMIDDGLSVKAADVVLDDINLTYPRDVLDLNMRLLDQLKSTNELGTNVAIEEGSTVDSCVVGNNVRISEGSKLHRSIVFDGVTISGANASNSLVTPYEMVSCH